MTALRLKLWGLVLVWSGAIFMFSTASFSSAHTFAFLAPLFHRFLPGASSDQIQLSNHMVRKAAHLTEYFVLGWLLLLAIRGPEHGWKLRWALLALLIAASYSATDEWHQSFVPGRDASAWDSLLDTTGTATGLTVTWVAFRRQQPSNYDADVSRAA